MFRLWYLAFRGKPSEEADHHHLHRNPISMLAVLVTLAVLSIFGGWIGNGAGLGRFGAFLSPVTGPFAEAAGSSRLETTLTGVALLVAVLGWLLADRIYHRNSGRADELAKTFSGPYAVLVNKYYVDEFYGATIIKPLLAFSTYILDWVVDKAVLGGLAWTLAGVAKFSGALLQRWQSGNIRSYAAWLAAGAAVLLLLFLIPFLLGANGISVSLGGH
jgi:NADH-quinone oxidoreductase subunit L